MLKKTFCLFLGVLLLLAACSTVPPEATPAPTPAPTPPPTPSPSPTPTPTPTESPEEAGVLKIMILGSSRSVNTFHLLYDIFRDQMPEQDITLGVMYYGSCSMSMHTRFIQENQPVYSYYRNTNGSWEILRDSTMEEGLRDQAWDVILLQAGNGDLDNSMNLACREFLTDYVDSVITHPHTFWWHTTWFNSTDPILYENPAEAKTREEQDKQYRDSVETAKTYVLNDPMFEGRICSGTPMMYALRELKVPEADLFRDHTHLSDFGSLLVGYSWYTQFTGNPVTEINLDVIPAAQRISQHRYLGDLWISNEMKQAIILTARYVLENPWTIPGQ